MTNITGYNSTRYIPPSSKQASPLYPLHDLLEPLHLHPVLAQELVVEEEHRYLVPGTAPVMPCSSSTHLVRSFQAVVVPVLVPVLLPALRLDIHGVEDHPGQVSLPQVLQGLIAQGAEGLGGAV